jgi:Bacterial SH3 domain
MRRGWGWIAALSVVACALTACATTAPVPEYQATEIPDGIRVRALPSHSSQVVGVLPASWDITALRRDREWVLVESARDGLTGWVYAPLPIERASVSTPLRPPPAARERVVAREVPMAPAPPKAQPPPVAAPAPTFDKPKAPALTKKPEPEPQKELRSPPDAEIIARMRAASRASYPGPCACPYDTDRAGRSCGRRSAFSRPGGYEPLCYPADVTPAMIERERVRLARLPAR